jgi:hypothetical protein
MDYECTGVHSVHTYEFVLYVCCFYVLSGHFEYILCTPLCTLTVSTLSKNIQLKVHIFNLLNKSVLNVSLCAHLMEFSLKLYQKCSLNLIYAHL